MNVNIYSESGSFPEYKTEGSSGMDLEAYLPGGKCIKLPPGGSALIPTGLSLELPKGFEAQIRPRSGLALKHRVTVLNSPSTIDSDYCGEIKVLLINHSPHNTFTVYNGMRVAQLVVAPVTHVTWDPVDEITNETERGEGGFGSTGLY